MLYMGDAADALTRLREAREMVGGEEGPRFERQASLVLAHLGRVSEARDELHRFLNDYHIGPEEDETPAGVLLRLLESALLVNAREVVAFLARRLAPVASSAICDQVELTCVARHLGAAAAFLGEPEQARIYYHQALEVCEQIRFRPEIALTRLGLAELLLEEAVSYQRSAINTPPASGDGGGLTADRLKAEGLAHLDFAIAEFRDMKMQPALERALKHKGLLQA